jgi:hypothetical protein
LTEPHGPLFSFNARGSVGKLLSFRRRGSKTIAESIPIHTDSRTSAQLAHRTMFQMCVDLWHTLTKAEQAAWESAARRCKMTGYAYYMSQCLRPNPGIYLPLAGGSMAGNIDMQSNRITNLPPPIADEEPDKLYIITANLRNPQASQAAVRLFIENHTLEGDYHVQELYGQGSTVGAGYANHCRIGYIEAGKQAMLLIYVTRGVGGYAQAICTNTRVRSSDMVMANTFLYHEFTDANITKLTLSSSIANGFGTGSQFLLCKPRTG